MYTKLRVLPISEAGECPFYVEDTEGSQVCFIKQLTTPVMAMSMMDERTDFHPSIWAKDCGGKYESCSVLPLLYHMKSAAVKELATVAADQGIETFDPFAEEDDEAEAVAQTAETQKKGGDASGPKTSQKDAAKTGLTAEPKDGPKGQAKKPPRPPVKVSVHQVENPFALKVDAIMYPTNNGLLVDDDYLLRITRSRVQMDCDRIKSEKRINMGGVYPTDGCGQMPAKRIYHAVVAGSSRLVNEADIHKATLRTLTVAEAEGARTLAMIPADCGTHDIYQTAIVQLSAVKQFLDKMEPENLQHIYVVMEDEESADAFTEYFDRIFGVEEDGASAA